MWCYNINTRYCKGYWIYQY